MFSRFCVIAVKATEKPALPQALYIGLLLRAGRPAGARAFQHSLSTGRMGGVPASANPSTRIPRLSA